MNYFTIALIVLYAGAGTTYCFQHKPLLGMLMFLYGVCMFIIDKIGAH